MRKGNSPIGEVILGQVSFRKEEVRKLRSADGFPFIYPVSWTPLQASQVVLVVKNLPANAGDSRDVSSITGSGRSPGEGNGYPLQDSCLENSMDSGVWQVTIHVVTNSKTRLSRT